MKRAILTRHDAPCCEHDGVRTFPAEAEAWRGRGAMGGCGSKPEAARAKPSCSSAAPASTSAGARVASGIGPIARAAPLSALFIKLLTEPVPASGAFMDAIRPIAARLATSANTDS